MGGLLLSGSRCSLRLPLPGGRSAYHLVPLGGRADMAGHWRIKLDQPGSKQFRA